jgi:hypothetical protein
VVTPREATAVSPSDTDAIGDYLISSRDFDEYRAMFRLTDQELAGRILDCPGGGASFTASACALGADARAVDPVYSHTARQLEVRLERELERGRAWARGRADAYVWDLHGDPETLTRRRAASARAFIAHLRAEPSRYTAASLPHLPLADDSIDLVLCSHLLFTYADRLDHDFHLAALLEMARVARRQVRVYPLLDASGRPQEALLDALITDVTREGLTAEVREVDHEFLRGAHHMLVLGS